MAQREEVKKLSLLEKAVEAAPDGIAIFDERDRFVYANPRYRELFGIENAGGYHGKSWRIAHPTREHDFVESEILTDVSIYGSWRGEVIAEDSGDRVQLVELSITDVGNASVWFARVIEPDDAIT